MFKGVLIGDPVSQSLSHITHNAVLKKIIYPGTYEKILVPQEKIKEALSELKKSKIKWLAVTMPLKDEIVPHLDYLRHRAYELQLVNTVLIKDGQWIGENCDGLGAMNAIEKEMQVRGKRLLIVGAGATAKAIAYEAKLRGAEVFIWNRTHIRAESICIDLQIECAYELTNEYDILINATSVGMFSEEFLIPADVLRGIEVVMDVVYSPFETPLLKTAKSVGCKIVSGLEMFLELSSIQLEWALNPPVTREELISIMRDSLNEIKL